MALSIRYVDQAAAGGGDGTTAATSGATGAWTLAEWATTGNYDTDWTASTDGMITYLKAASPWTSHATLDMNTVGSNVKPFIMEGYTTTVGDGGQVSITLASGNYFRFNSGCANVTVKNIEINADRSNTPILLQSSGGVAINCRFINTNLGASADAFTGVNTALIDCYVENATATQSNTGAAIESGGSLRLIRVTVNAKGGAWCFSVSSSNVIKDCIFIGNGSAGTRGLSFASGNTFNVVTGCVFYDLDSPVYFATENIYASFTQPFLDCIAYTVGGYGIHSAGATKRFGNYTVTNFAMGNVTSGRHNLGSAFDEVEINPITLTADPFVDAANGDFRLNDVDGGGALCKNITPVGGWPSGDMGTSGTNNIGAVQTVCAAGGGPVTIRITTPNKRRTRRR